MSSDYLRIEKAIKYLEEHFRDQPNLEDIAQHLDLSPFHLQRLFRRWVGISPKRFLQFLTIEYAKKQLDESRSVLDATYESGLSSPGRMHDLFVTIDAVTPGEFKTQGAGLQIFYGIHPSPFGECLLAVTERGICYLAFITDAGQDEVLADLHQRWGEAKLNENPQSTQPLLDKVFPPVSPSGKRSVTLFVRGTNFQIKVWEALIRIPPGFVCSYQDVARYIGKPTGAQAVGNAIGANPASYIIPCHRVIQKMGIIGNYRWSPTRKKAMIGWEAAQRYRQEVQQHTSL